MGICFGLVHQIRWIPVVLLSFVRVNNQSRMSTELLLLYVTLDLATLDEIADGHVQVYRYSEPSCCVRVRTALVSVYTVLSPRSIIYLIYSPVILSGSRRKTNRRGD